MLVRSLHRLVPFALAGLLLTGMLPLTGCNRAGGNGGDSLSLLNVSYDPTRELYAEFNQAFAQHWREQTGQEIQFEQSHGGAGKQARAVMDGLKADVVTLALSYDIDVIAEKTGGLSRDWQSKLPHNSSPYTSTIVFLVRKGNPQSIRDWNDLVRPGVGVITPNPKTSGGARWNYLAAWAYAMRQQPGNEEHARQFIAALFKNVKVLDSGARGATTTFAQRGIGDVLLTWENEAFLAIKELGDEELELVVPSLSIRAEPPVAVMEKNAQAHGTLELAQEYLKYLYSPVGQKLVARHYYRPVSPEHADPADLARFADVEQVTIADLGGWHAAQAKHFADGAIFDQIYSPGN